jgi:DNA-binding CsgD family transcriptional regulator
MDPANEGLDRSRLRLVLSVMFLAILLGAGGDLVLDHPATLWSAHVLFEAGVVLMSLASVTYLWWGWWRAEESIAELHGAVAEHQAELAKWRESARSSLEGLGAAIDAQFARWSLTGAEREVALLLLQGHGHKQVAAQTGRSERTVRQHAVAVYQKSGLRGRAELAAFFLGDLALPGAAR